MNQLKEIRDMALVNAKEVIKQNKEKVLEGCELVISLLQKARNEGLLALEYEACFIPMDMVLGDYLIWIIEMVCDGTDPDYLSELMTINFMSNDYRGIDGIMYYLYSRSMLMLQAGMNQIQVEDFFISVTSVGGLKFDTRYKIHDEENQIEKWRGMLADTEKELIENITCQLNSLLEDEWKAIVARDGFCGFDKIFPYLDEKVQFRAKKYINKLRYYLIILWATELKEKELEEMNNELTKFILDSREIQRRREC